MERFAQLTLNKTVAKVQSEAKCPYCLDSIDKTTVNKSCADCGAEMHRACRYEHGRCASCASWNFKGEVKDPKTGSIHRLIAGVLDPAYYFSDFSRRNPILGSVIIGFALLFALVVAIVAWVLYQF